MFNQQKHSNAETVWSVLLITCPSVYVSPFLDNSVPPQGIKMVLSSCDAFDLCYVMLQKAVSHLFISQWDNTVLVCDCLFLLEKKLHHGSIRYQVILSCWLQARKKTSYLSVYFSVE